MVLSFVSYLAYNIYSCMIQRYIGVMIMITYLLVCHDVVTQTVLQDNESVIFFLKKFSMARLTKHATCISTGQLIKYFSLSLSSYDSNNKYM